MLRLSCVKTVLNTFSEPSVFYLHMNYSSLLHAGDSIACNELAIRRTWWFIEVCYSTTIETLHSSVWSKNAIPAIVGLCQVTIRRIDLRRNERIPHLWKYVVLLAQLRRSSSEKSPAKVVVFPFSLSSNMSSFSWISSNTSDAQHVLVPQTSHSHPAPYLVEETLRGRQSLHSHQLQACASRCNCKRDEW